MDRETFPYVYKALLGVSLIGMVCLTLVLLLTHRADRAVPTHLFWLQGFVVVFLTACVGAVLWHAEKHRRALEQALSEKTEALPSFLASPCRSCFLKRLLLANSGLSN